MSAQVEPQPRAARIWQEPEQLSDQSRLLESVIEFLPDCVILAECSGSFLIFNAAAQQILGLGSNGEIPTEWVQTEGYYLSDGVTPYPVDQMPLIRALRGEEVRDAEILLRNEAVPEGRWIHANAIPWQDDAGPTRGALIILRDVTDERRSRELNERLSNVVEQTADSVCITESNGTIVYVNPAFEHITGYSRSETLGLTPRLLRSGHHDEHLYEELWESLSAGGVFRGTLINRKKNGEIFHAEHTISPIAGADGSFDYLVSVAKDITERLRIERNQVELDAAHAIQQRLYPRDAPQTPGFDIAGGAYPAESLCGDYFDYFPMDGGYLGMTVADVCGHGIGPSILMAQARAYLRTHARSHADVGEVLRLLNETLTVEGSQQEFVTQILLRLDPDARTLVFANAGHPSGFLLDRDGEVREELRSCGVPLGIFSDSLYPPSRAIRLEPGEIIVLFTDGITESSGPDDLEFGSKRVVDVIRRHRLDPARHILEALYQAASSFRFDGPQLDDMTAIICKVER